MSSKLNYKSNIVCYDIDNCPECLYKHQVHIEENEKNWFMTCIYIWLYGTVIFGFLCYSIIYKI
jgi:hypothetical protein